jgi:hypothetical protein
MNFTSLYHYIIRKCVSKSWIRLGIWYFVTKRSWPESWYQGQSTWHQVDPNDIYLGSSWSHFSGQDAIRYYPSKSKIPVKKIRNRQSISRGLREQFTTTAGLRGKYTINHWYLTCKGLLLTHWLEEFTISQFIVVPLGLAVPLGLVVPFGLAVPLGFAVPFGLVVSFGLVVPLCSGVPLGLVVPFNLVVPFGLAVPLGFVVPFSLVVL